MLEKKCRHCAMMIPKETKVCPHCRKNTGMSRRVKLFIVLGLLIVIGHFMDEKEKKINPNPTTKYYVATESLKLRQEPSLKSGVIRILNCGEKIEAEKDQAGWVKTSDGYLQSSFLINEGSLLSPEYYLVIEKSTWTSWRYNLMAEFTVAVKNIGPCNIKDARFLINYYAKSRTYLNSVNEIVYDVFPAGKVKVVKLTPATHPQTASYNMDVQKASWVWE